MDLLEALDSAVFIGEDESRLVAGADLLISRSQIESVKELGELIGLRFFSDSSDSELSAAGRVFAREVAPLYQSLRELVLKCRNIQRGDTDSLVLQDLPFPLIFEKKISTALYSFMSNGLLVGISLRPTEGLKTIDAIRSHHIDVGFYADPGDEESVVARLEKVGIAATPLRKEKFVLRANKNHPLARKDPLLPIDLLDYPVMISKSESLDMLKELLTKAFSGLGMVPTFFEKEAGSYTEFYVTPLDDCVQVVDESTEKAIGDAQDQVVFRHFDDETFEFTRYLIYDSTIDNRVVKMFVKAVVEAEEDGGSLSALGERGESAIIS